MPVIGLNGFMFGPSKSIINTRAVNSLPELPMKVQLYLGKYPETKCTVKAYKPSMKLSDLLHDPNQFPSWMNGISGEPMCSSLPSSGEISDRGSSSILTSTTNKSSEPSKPVVIRSGNRTTKTRVSVSSRNLRQPISSISRVSQESPYRMSSSQASPVSPPVEQKISRRTKPALRSGGRLFVTVRRTVCTSLSVPMSSSPKVHTSTRNEVLADSNPGTSKMTRNSPLLRTPKSTRIPRRERNRVREEAEKEAILRAYKFQKPCTSLLEARNLAVSESPGT